MPPQASSSANERPHLRVVPGGAAQRPEMPSDDELIAAVCGGDHRIAGRLYDKLGAVVDSTLFRLVGRREADHDDLVQSTFEQIVVTLVRGKFARQCSLTTWASSVAAHVALNAIRSRTRERRVVDRSAPGDVEAISSRVPVDIEREAGLRIELDRLRRSLAAISADKAETIVLHDVLGHELSDIAEMMGVTVAAAQSRLVRGRRELQARMAEQGMVDERGEGT